MFCPKCGKINPDSSTLCSGCNTPLYEEKETLPEKKISWGRIILAFAIIAVAVVVALSGCGGKIPQENMTF